VDSSEIVRGIGLVVVLGVGLQWLGRRIGLPSIVLLLAGGLAVGPGLGWLDPDEIFGDALFPVVSLAVAVLLFHGGMELRLADLRGPARGPVLRLVTVGALTTWLLAAGTVHLLLDGAARLSLVIGAILVVSGPTVVGPLLRIARPRDPPATILRWEGILIDPLGATLGVFCVNAFFVTELSLQELWRDVLSVALAGVAAGLAGAALLVTALRRLTVPDELEVAVPFMFVVAAYVAAESVRPEAGLFATTAMGVAVANQRVVPTRELRAFGEPVVALLLGALFVVLAARVDGQALIDHVPEALALAAVLALVVRPLVVVLSTLGQPGLDRRDRAFLACLAPRGVVAAATAALYSLRLDQIGEPADGLVPVVFAVVIALALLYGLGAAPAARWLGVARPSPRGALLVGGHRWLLGLAAALTRHGVPVVVAARGRADLAGRDDLPFRVHTGLITALPASGLLDDVGGAVIASRDDEVDLIALDVAVSQLGRGAVWVLPSEPAGGGARRADPEPDPRTWSRRPFSPGATHDALDAAVVAGHEVRTVDADDVPEGAHVLAVLTPAGRWTASVDGPPPPGSRLVVLDPAPVAAGERDGAAAAIGDPEARRGQREPAADD